MISLAWLILSAALSCGLFAAKATAAETAGASDPIIVHVDQAKLMHMSDHVGTIIVGNPLIADVSIQPGNLLVVTGKGFGVTNFLALDRSGKVLSDKLIKVKGPEDDIVVVYRGAERETYSCLPICQRRITLGDGSTYFDAVIGQSTNRNMQAQTGLPAASAQH